MQYPIPVSVLTGFLGAGKTTLLNRLLKDASLADTAVIINEFGSVAIDHLLVEEAGGDGVIELADGCVCCTVRGELVDTLADLVDRLQTGRIAKLARVIIETTGLADPGPVLQALMAHPALVQAFRLDGVVAVVDAVNGDRTLDNHFEAVRQVAMADRILLSKLDLVEGGRDADSSSRHRALIRRLERLNPGASILDVCDQEAQQLSCGLYNPSTGRADSRRWLEHDPEKLRDFSDKIMRQNNELEQDADSSSRHPALGEDRHRHGDHHHHQHDQRIRAISLVEDRPLPFAALESFVDILQSTHGDRLLRLKGVIELADDPARPLVLHAVQRIFHPPVRLKTWPDDTRGTRLVLIVDGVPEEYVRRLWAAAIGRPAIDTPDRAALVDNPLAIAGLRA